VNGAVQRRVDSAVIKYTFEPWVQTYTKWFGILQLVGLNLAGIIWLAWASNMKNIKGYQPKWIYWIHWIIVVALTVEREAWTCTDHTGPNIACALSISSHIDTIQ